MGIKRVKSDGSLNWEAFEEELKESPFSSYDQILYTLFRYHIASLFEYTGLPEAIPEEIMEYVLYEKGQGIFFTDVDDGELTFLPFGSTETKDKYSIPTMVTATPLDTSQSMTQQIKIGDEGIIWKAFFDLKPLSPRYMITPLIVSMRKIMVKKHTNLLDSNIAAVFEVESGQEKTFSKEMGGVFNSDKSYVVVVNDGMNKENKSTQLRIPYNQADFWEDYHNTKSEVFNMLGINSNDNVDKKERMNIPEVDANNDESNNILDSMLKARKIAVERTNKLFKINIGVELTNQPEEEPEGDDPELDEDGNPIERDEEGNIIVKGDGDE